MAFCESSFSVVCDRRALLIVGALLSCGCAVIGPRSITAGRGVYADVISRTADEQLLNVIVRMRYDETFGMISVASVTANLRFSAQIGTNIGVGSSDNYAGNLVPLSGGVAYEENPTISYLPLSGEDFMQRMIAPIPAAQWIMLARSARHPGRVFAVAIGRINQLRNRLVGEGPSSPEFARVVELYERLRRDGVLDLVQRAKSETEKAFFWDFHDYADAYGDSVRELLDLVGVEAELDGSPILLPIREAIGASASAIHLQTRSAYDVLQAFGAGIEIPPSHLEAGIVEPVPDPDEKRVVTIHSSEKHWWDMRPDDATVAIRFRDRWFYIDSADTRSKRAFAFLRTLIGIRLKDPGATQRAPVITIPAN